MRLSPKLRGLVALSCLLLAAAGQEPVSTVFLSQGTVKPKLQITPSYPRGAKARGLKGSVVIKVLIGTNGKVEKVSQQSGNRELGYAAMDAIRYWRYAPYTVAGKPVKVETLIVVGFK